MKALILNSGLGSRMGVLTSEHPKCMTEISARETILSRQLRMLADAGITDVVMTTGAFDSVLVSYCNSLELPLHITFVKNPVYDRTNYIYSIYCAREYLRDTAVILMHGDLVFENTVLDDVLASAQSCMTVSTSLELPEKDFKAVIADGRSALNSSMMPSLRSRCISCWKLTGTCGLRASSHTVNRAMLQRQRAMRNMRSMRSRKRISLRWMLQTGFVRRSTIRLIWRLYPQGSVRLKAAPFICASRPT